jgi:hypothetical protein
MIFPARIVEQILAGETAEVCRPAVRPNGRMMAYHVGGVYPLQPGRFAPHVGHIRIETLEIMPLGALKAHGEWDVPEAWDDGLLLAVMKVKVEAPCPRCG